MSVLPFNHDIEDPSYSYHDGTDPFYERKYKKRFNTLLHYVHEDTVKFASERIHDIIAEENGLRHNRMTWFANIEGFLWLSLAALISEKLGWEKGFWLTVLIPIIGILVCFSALSAIWDADHAVENLLKKWRVIQDSQPNSPYTVIPVIGLSYTELEAGHSIPRSSFVLFVLVGWIVALTVVVVKEKGPHWGYFVLIWISVLGVVIWLKWPCIRNRIEVTSVDPPGST